MNLTRTRLLSASILSALALFCGNSACADMVSIESQGLRFHIQLNGSRYGFTVGGKSVITEDANAGVLLAGSPVTFRRGGNCSGTECRLEGISAAGGHLRLSIKLSAHRAELIAEPQNPGEEVRFVTGGASPAYGLADHAVEQRKFSTLPNKQFNTDVSGFVDDRFLSGQGGVRLVSNFLIYPQQCFAELLVDPTVKIVHTSSQQIVEGVAHPTGPVHLYYFFGDPHVIYSEYLRVRNDSGYRVFMPKYEAFGVGWEAFGALGWETNQKTVQESVDRYIAEGYPLRWLVIGSGFWPSAPEMHETTSFGLWDKEKYPDPTSLVHHFLDEHLAVLLGLRITFITTGPYSEEGVAKGYFLKEDGKAKEFRGGWPKLPYYLLDAHNPAALDWYMGLVKRWQSYGINGWKEDFYGYHNYELPDDKVDPTNDRLMHEGQLVIERNGYLSSNGDLHRINDFNYDQNQDRGPVNALALAYSGFPLVYPDIVGGTFGENRFSAQRSPRMETYMMRNAQWAALHSSMGMGEPPWTFSPQVSKIMLQSAKLHAQIAPYLYSNARRFAADGYPWTMTPLPIAFSGDPKAYGHENATDRGYEWMIGDALLATPLYGDDYDTANARDVYLPEGRWMDFDTGKFYDGHQTLKDYAFPVGKTPLFVGGSGVVLEEIGGTVKACVYPVAQQASASMTLPGDDKPFTVRVKGFSPGGANSKLRVLDASGKPVEVTAIQNGFSFVPKAGEQYTAQAF